MAAFSISDAAIDGFRVLRQQWRVVLGWGVFNLLALLGGAVLLVVLLIATVPFAGSRDAAGLVGAVLGVLILGLGGLAVEVMVQTAIYRVMLRPEAPGFLHLRLGGDELRVAVADLVLILAAVPVIAIAALVAALAARVSPVVGSLAAVALLLGGYALLLRVSLAPVIAFAGRRIDLAAAWRRTTGQTWRLLGMALMLLCLVAFIAVAAWIAVFLLSGFTTGFQDLGLSDAETAARHPGRYILGLAVQTLLVPVFLTLTQAPWVAVYRALTPEDAAA